MNGTNDSSSSDHPTSNAEHQSETPDNSSDSSNTFGQFPHYTKIATLVTSFLSSTLNLGQNHASENPSPLQSSLFRNGLSFLTIFLITGVFFWSVYFLVMGTWLKNNSHPRHSHVLMETQEGASH